MIQFIPDINFKISLTAIKVISKFVCLYNLIARILSLGNANLKKIYSQLVTQLIEKLADSKVVIRQAVLKCCS